MLPTAGWLASWHTFRLHRGGFILITSFHPCTHSAAASLLFHLPSNWWLLSVKILLTNFLLNYNSFEIVLVPYWSCYHQTLLRLHPIPTKDRTLSIWL